MKKQFITTFSFTSNKLKCFKKYFVTLKTLKKIQGKKIEQKLVVNKTKTYVFVLLQKR